MQTPAWLRIRSILMIMLLSRSAPFWKTEWRALEFRFNYTPLVQRLWDDGKMKRKQTEEKPCLELWQIQKASEEGDRLEGLEAPLPFPSS